MVLSPFTYERMEVSDCRRTVLVKGVAESQPGSVLCLVHFALQLSSPSFFMLINVSMYFE